MDEPQIPSNRARSVGIAILLLVSPAVLLMLQLSLVKGDEMSAVILWAGPVIGGVSSGILFSRALARTPTAQLVTALVLCPVCILASLAIAFIGCSIVAPIRS